MVHHLKTDILLVKVAKDSLKPINTIIRLNIISYYFVPLNTYQCLIYQTYQYNCNRQKNDTFPSNNTSQVSEALNPSDILSEQTWVGKLTILLLALILIKS